MPSHFDVRRGELFWYQSSRKITHDTEKVNTMLHPVDRGKTSEAPQALHDLQLGNARFREQGRPVFEEQNPKILTVNCGRLVPEIAFRLNELGKIFQVSKRGATLCPEHAGSFDYAASHFKLRLGLIMTHACTVEGVCRLTACQNDATVLGHEEARDYNFTHEGLSLVGLRALQGIPACDYRHALTTAIRMLKVSEDMHQRVVDGKMILGLSYYNNQTGEASFPAFITSGKDGLELPRPLLQAYADGDFDLSLERVHKSLKQLRACVVGNSIHVANFHPAVPTEHVIFGCSDSRAAPYVVFNAPYGLLEIVRNAGNVVNSEVIYSLAIAVKEALKHRPSVNLIVMTHSQCGAMSAMLNSCPIDVARKCEEEHRDPMYNVLHNLHQRFANHREVYPEMFHADEHKIEAAHANAKAALADIVHAPGEHADYLREQLRSGHLSIYPSTYNLRSGEVRWLVD